MDTVVDTMTTLTVIVTRVGGETTVVKKKTQSNVTICHLIILTFVVDMVYVLTTTFACVNHLGNHLSVKLRQDPTHVLVIPNVIQGSAAAMVVVLVTICVIVDWTAKILVIVKTPKVAMVMGDVKKKDPQNVEDMENVTGTTEMPTGWVPCVKTE